MKEFSKEELDKQQEIVDDFKQQFKTKSITFDKEAQEKLPQHIKDKMKADRENARKKQLTIHGVSNNEAVLQYETCQRGKMVMCKCKSDQDCKKHSEVAYYCECDAPLVRTDVSGTEYCGICEWDIEQ